MSLRFYNSDGKIVFDVQSVDGKTTRKPTLADAKRLGLYLSVSTVAKMGGDTGSLEHWFKTEPLRVAAKASAWKLLQDNPDAWLGAMLDESTSAMGKAATRGSLVHKMAEDYSRWRINPAKSFAPTGELEPYALALHKVFLDGKITPFVEGIERAVFDKKSQTSGTLDLQASHAFGKKNVLIDFKTQGFKSGKATDYFNYRLQIAAYSNAAYGKPGWCAIIYLDTSKHGTPNHTPKSEVVLISPKESRELYKYYKMCAKIKYASLNWAERAKAIK